MEILINLSKLLAGIGLFLFAIQLLEVSLKNLSGRTFKIFLQKITKNRIGAAVGGAIVTSVLQSSSMVAVMVLAFVGAGVFTLQNAMAIILGANVGTTIASWMVATLGFKVNIEMVAYPAVFAGGLILIAYGQRKSFKDIAYFLFGFGLLFIGLSFMKTGMEGQVRAIDFSKYLHWPLLIFLIIGFIMTVLVQSSSVTMAITLSALHAGAIDFPIAAALVLGSETGTTIKVLIGSAGDNVTKKRVALGNILFNIFTTVAAFILLKPMIILITQYFHITDPLIGLVTFSSLTNLFALIIFLPILNPYIKFLHHFYKDKDGSIAAYIHNASIGDRRIAMELFRKETEFFIHNSLIFNLSLFDIDSNRLPESGEYKLLNEKRKYIGMTPEEKYDFLKQLQGQLQAFYMELRPTLAPAQYEQVNQWIAAVRNCMHAVKSMKDIGSNIHNLSQSSKDIKFNFFTKHQRETEAIYQLLYDVITHPGKNASQLLQNIHDRISNNYTKALNDFYKEALSAAIEDKDITTVINFNRELYSSNKSLVMAIQDLILDEKNAHDFNDLPVIHL
jgi:phosphate:Na+ symporter